MIAAFQVKCSVIWLRHRISLTLNQNAVIHSHISFLQYIQSADIKPGHSSTSSASVSFHRTDIHGDEELL